jgi:hypothetical protein
VFLMAGKDDASEQQTTESPSTLARFSGKESDVGSFPVTTRWIVPENRGSGSHNLIMRRNYHISDSRN